MACLRCLPLKCLPAVIVLHLAAYLPSLAQRLPFYNYSVDKGLIQSQVLAITQDKQNHLWIGTYSGLDRFDGTTFRHFNKSDGLASNAVTALMTARDGKIWMATFTGLASFDGYRFENYAMEDSATHHGFSSLACDPDGNIWAFEISTGLYRLKGNKVSKAPLPQPGAIATAFHKTGSDSIQVSFHKLGIFTFSKGVWKKTLPPPALAPKEFIISSYYAGGYCYYVTSNGRILKYAGNKPVKEIVAADGTISETGMDNNGNIWVGTANGAVVYDAGLQLRYRCNAASGLSDNLVAEIYSDRHGNVWIGSDGDGLFRFSGALFRKHDRSTGLPGNIVMGFCRDEDNNFYIATREGGLVKRLPVSGRQQRVDYSSISTAGINCIAKGNDGIYFGTMDNKLVSYSRGKCAEIHLARGASLFVNNILHTPRGLFISTSTGVYIRSGDSVFKVPGIQEITTGVLPLAGGETLIGTTNGLYTYRQGGVPQKVQHPLLQRADIICLKMFRQYVLAGTADAGLLAWHPQTNAVLQCDTRNGLSDNQVFGIMPDARQRIWVGTGTGLHLVSLAESGSSFHVRRFSTAQGYESSETNLNAIEQDGAGLTWIGTTKGAFVYNEKETPFSETAPYVVIQQVTAPALRDTAARMDDWYHLPANATLPYSNSSISFKVKGILLNDPENITYSTQLAGLDNGFSAPSGSMFYNYQNLQPGDYVFKVKAVTKDGVLSANEASFAFTIATPFHKSTLFYVLLTAALILFGVGLQLLFSRLKQRRRRALERLRRQEQEKIRQRTAEDFHDELGNKLTRISLLTDILEKKMKAGHDADNAGIIHQIRENVGGVYTGTREVIWSLSPGSNNLSDVLKHIKEFGNELFNNSDIDFTCHGAGEADAAIALPMDYGRNITMIAKETLNNSLRHAGCTRVSVEMSVNPAREVRLVFADNGKGFDPGKVAAGNGLSNIRRRADRIQATLRIQAPRGGQGAITTLSFKIPLNEG